MPCNLSSQRFDIVTRISDVDFMYFLGAVLRSPRHVGALAPSSRAVAEQMLAGLDFHRGNAVLELGPGTGAFTSVLMERLPNPAAYLAIERDPELLRLLRRRFPKLHFVHGSAEDAVEYLEPSGCDSVQAQRTAIRHLPRPMQERIFVMLQSLMTPGVVFRAIQYFHAQPMPSAVRFRRRMSTLFGPVQVSRPVLWNLPPAVGSSWAATATVEAAGGICRIALLISPKWLKISR